MGGDGDGRELVRVDCMIDDLVCVTHDLPLGSLYFRVRLEESGNMEV